MNEEEKIGQSDNCILLVEDNPDHAELIQETIRESKVLNNVVWIDNGAEAIEYIKGDGKFNDETKYPKPCLILLDIKLPGKNGKEILAEIKSNEKTLSIPVVMLTSSDQDRDIVDCYRLGANSYITKPMAFNEFIEKVQAIPMYWLLVNKLPAK